MKAARILTAAAALMVGLIGAEAQAEQYRLGLITPPPHQWSKSAVTVAERIKEATNGRVEILVFPWASLATRRRCSSSCRPARSTSPS